jgi:DNA-binding NtrC family response regulator
VLLLGPSGAGTTWAARRIHDQSGRRGAFVALNAAALPTDPAALRSVLLGHKKGAFTGADRDVVGAFVAADHGTLFLDEVDSLSAVGQGFLLTLLEQSGDLLPLGAPPLRAGETPARRDVRVVAASKLALAQAGLRSDLAYRLVDGSLVELLALAARRADIPGLVRGFPRRARPGGRARRGHRRRRPRRLRRRAVARPGAPAAGGRAAVGARGA